MPFWPLFLRELSFTAVEIGYLVGILMATKIVAPNIWGWLALRSQRRMAVIRGGALLSLVFFAGVFFERSFWGMAVIIALFSFFWNAILAQFEVVTLSHLRQYYSLYSRIRMWGSIGFIFTVVLFGWLFDLISLMYLPWVVCALLLALWLSSLTVDEKKRRYYQQHSPQFWRRLLREKVLLAFFVSCFLLQLSHGPYYTFFSVYLVEHDYSRASTGVFWSLGVMAEVVVFLVMHRMLQRFSLSALLRWSLFLTALRWAVIALWVDNIYLLVPAQLLHAASFGIYHAVAVEFIRQRFSGQDQGQGMALYSGLSYGAGGAAGAVLSGWLWQWSASGSFLLAALMALLALAICSRIEFQQSPSTIRQR